MKLLTAEVLKWIGWAAFAGPTSWTASRLRLAGLTDAISTRRIAAQGMWYGLCGLVVTMAGAFVVYGYMTGAEWATLAGGLLGGG